jgi:hypothetical protein
MRKPTNEARRKPWAKPEVRRLATGSAELGGGGGGDGSGFS